MKGIRTPNRATLKASLPTFPIWAKGVSSPTKKSRNVAPSSPRSLRKSTELSETNPPTSLPTAIPAKI